MARPLFQLGPRLATCAGLLEGGRPVADIGTDHGYLPIWLVKRGLAPVVVAADINPKPLAVAKGNAQRYGVAGKVIFTLSDGLQNVPPELAQEIVLAGMGGELILRVLAAAPWVKAGDRRLVLQPMSRAPELRRGLSGLGFEVLEERALEDGGRVYSAFSARYLGAAPTTGRLFPYMGKIAPGTEAAEKYAKRVLAGLWGQLRGLSHKGEALEASRLREAAEAIEHIYL